MRWKEATRVCCRRGGLVLFVGCACAALLCACAAGGRHTKKVSSTYGRYLKGLMSDRLGDFAGALRYWEETRDFDNTAVAPYIHAGFDDIRLGKIPEAVSEFEKVLHLDPHDDTALSVLAMLFVQTEEFKKAALYYEKLLARHLDARSQNIRLRHILSQLYFLQEDRSSARRHAEGILRLDASDTEARYFLAMLDSDEGRLKEAVAGFQKILDENPGHADAMNALAYLWAEEGIELPRALDLSEKTLLQDPENAAFLDTLGWIYFKLGEPGKAVAFLEKAAQDTFDPVILNHLAEAYLKQGRLEDARKRWRSSLILNPRQKEIREKLKALNQK